MRPCGWTVLAATVAVGALLTVAGCGGDEAPVSVPEEAVPDPDGFAFFDKLSGTLDIELTEAPVKITEGLENKKAKATARLESLQLKMKVFENDDFRPITEEELARIVFRGKRVRLKGDAGKPVTHEAPNGSHFTVKDMWKAVEETERQTRDQTEWFGGIDVHHIFYEGLTKQDDGSWFISWGS